MKISKEQLQTTVEKGEAERVWPNGAHAVLAKFQGDYDWSEDIGADVRKLLESSDASIDLDALLPNQDDELWIDYYPQHYGHHLFFVANMAAACRVGEPSSETTDALNVADFVTQGSLEVNGDLTCSGRLVVGGSLTVRGDLTVGTSTVVCGDCSVDGTWRGTDDFTAHAVIGDLKVEGPLLVFGETFVSGNVVAQDVFVHNPDYVGYLRILGDVFAGRLVESLTLVGDPRSIIQGSITLSDATPVDPEKLLAEAFS